MSYHPELAPVVIRVDRDDEYIKKLEDYLAQAQELFSRKIKTLKDKGFL